jgi:prolyl oligopeptidase
MKGIGRKNHLQAWGIVLAVALGISLGATGESMQYPPSRKSDTADVYFGTKVADPYRWMEDLDSEETKQWVAAENKVTFEYLDQIPGREALKKRLTEIWNYPRTGVPLREAGQLFYTHNSGLQRQAEVYRQSSLTSAPSVLLDPNTFSPDGSVALAGFSISPAGNYVAYGRSEGGSDWTEFRVRELASGKELPDRVQWTKFSNPSWTKDGKGFFYSRYPEPPKGKVIESAALNHRVYYHVAGTSQDKDRLIFELKDKPDWLAIGGVTEDGRYLVIYAVKGTDPKNQLYLLDLKDAAKPDLTSPVRPFIVENDASYIPLGTVGGKFYVLTDLDAPKRRIVAVDLRAPSRENWKTIVPQGNEVIEESLLAGGRIAAHYLVDVKSEVSLFTLEGKRLGSLPQPGIGSIQGLSGRNDTPEIFYSFASVLIPPTVFRYDLKTSKRAPFAETKVAFDPSRFETTQVFYPSKDGTKIPMFLTGRRGMARDASNPVLMYAYGGFSVSVRPQFNPAIAGWLEMGGVYAVPNLRGGGEYGEEWHRAGMLAKKQNVFDDFQAAAEYLVREKITSTGKLAIWGGSNGGLLVGAAMTQRPDLYAVALPEVGVLDMLRFHKFSAGVFWVTEYGSSDDEKMFQTLQAYSPLHNLKAGTCYPATLITTADHDDRVVPSHSFKFAAALQAAQGCARPVLIRVETQASHGYSPTDKRIAEVTDVLAFAAKNLNMPPTPPDRGSR